MWWKSKRWPDEKYSSPTTSNNSLNPALTYYGTKTRVRFTGSCLKQHKITFTHKNVVNIYIVYELGASGSHDNDPTLKNSMFGIGFDRKLGFHFQLGDLVKM